MKKKILEALTTKFPGVADSILDGIAAKLAETVTTEDQVKTAAEGVTFSQVLQSYGDARANQAQASAVKNYEKKYGLKDGRTIEEGGRLRQTLRQLRRTAEKGRVALGRTWPPTFTPTTAPYSARNAPSSSLRREPTRTRAERLTPLKPLRNIPVRIQSVSRTDWPL